MMNRRNDDPPQMIRVSSERLIRAKKFRSCECTAKYCDHHRGQCGEGLGQGWKIRLHPPRERFGEPREITSDAFEALLKATVALCASCASGHPHLLFDPS